MADDHRAARRGPRRSSGDDVVATTDRAVAGDNGGLSDDSVSVISANVHAGRLDSFGTSDHRQPLCVNFARSCIIRPRFADNNASVPGIDGLVPGNHPASVDNEVGPGSYFHCDCSILIPAVKILGGGATDPISASDSDERSSFIYGWRCDDQFVRREIYGRPSDNRRLRPVIYVPGSHIYRVGSDNSHGVIDN